MQEGEWDNCFNCFFFFLLCLQGGKRRQRLLIVKLYEHPGMGGLSFDDPLETLMWGRVF